MEKKATVITLLTDFGVEDAYVGCMKGVILSIYPHAKVTDISHGVPKFNIRYGAFILMQAAPYFPTGTVHVAVVDPGVGAGRLPIAIETHRYVFIGPDNGVLSLAATKDGVKSVRSIENERYMLRGPAKTFAGRDVFAPVAAHVAMGIPLTDLGPKLKAFQKITVPKPRVEKAHIMGEVFVVDSFGNLVTNIHVSDIAPMVKYGQRIIVEVKGFTIELPFVFSYGEVGKGQALALVGSSGFMEVAVNQGDVSKKFKIKPSEPLKILF